MNRTYPANAETCGQGRFMPKREGIVSHVNSLLSKGIAARCIAWLREGRAKLRNVKQSKGMAPECLAQQRHGRSRRRFT